MSEYEVSGTAMVNEEVDPVMMDQEIEIDVDDVRCFLRVSLAVNELQDGLTNALESVITDASQDYTQVEIPMTVIYTLIKK